MKPRRLIDLLCMTLGLSFIAIAFLSPMLFGVPGNSPFDLLREQKCHMVELHSVTTTFTLSGEMCEETAIAMGLTVEGDRAYGPRTDNPNPPAIANTIEIIEPDPRRPTDNPRGDTPYGPR